MHISVSFQNVFEEILFSRMLEILLRDLGNLEILSG